MPGPHRRHAHAVVELYTSEGCSSCPPADRWLSTLKGQPVVAQAFHVGYWDYIGWVDRFASPAHTTRQRQVAAAIGLRNIYTPQVVRNGQDWREYSNATAATEPARAAITLRRTAGNDNFEATVTPDDGTGHWTAYWTVTEHGHSSRVKSGENAGRSCNTTLWCGSTPRWAATAVPRPCRLPPSLRTRNIHGRSTWS